MADMEDDDAFLYGDAGPPVEAPAPPAPAPAPAPADEAEDMQQDESDDDIEIILDAEPGSTAAPAPQFGRGVPYALRAQNQLNVASTPFAPGASASPAPPVQSLRPVPAFAPAGVPVQPHPPPSLPAEPTKPAVVDGDQKITDVDLDSLDDKPWRRPGAHQADFFNYGFDEFTWKAHCARQKDTRSESEQARDQPFSVFATMPAQEAWNTLPPALKGALTSIVFQAVQGQGGMMPFGGMMPGMPPPPMGMPPGLPQPPHQAMQQQNMAGPGPGGMGHDDGFRGQKRGRNDNDEGDYGGDDGSSYAGGGPRRGGRPGGFDQGPDRYGGPGRDRDTDRRRRDTSEGYSERVPIPSRPSRDESPVSNGPPSRGGKPPPRGPRAGGRDTGGSYRDKDAYGASNDGLDYGYDHRDRDPRDYQDSKRRK